QPVAVVRAEGAVRAARDLVHALAVLGGLLRQAGGGDAGVGGRPGGAAVPGLVDAAGGHGDGHRPRVGPGGVHPARNDGVHRAAARAGEPVLAVRVVPEGADQLEAVAAVGGAEQRVRLGAGVDHAGLVGEGELPGAGERLLDVVGEGDRRLLRFGPGAAEVVAAPDAGAEVRALRAGQHPAGVRVDADRVDPHHVGVAVVV